MTANLESLVAEAHCIVDEAVKRMEREIGRELEDDEYEALVDDLLSELDDEEEPELFRYAASFDEKEHPRGQPDNAGQFAEKPGSDEVKEHEPESRRPAGTYKIDKNRVDAGAVRLAAALGLKGVETAEQFAQFFGIQPDQDMDAVEVWCEGPLLKTLAFTAEGPWGTAHRSMKKEPNGDLVIKNRWLEIKETGTGASTKMLVSQVKNAIEAGVKRIECEASGSAEDEKFLAEYNEKNGRKDKPLIGYRNWPKHGFDGPIDGLLTDDDDKKYISDILPDEWKAKKLQTVLDIYSKPGGEQWWRENGVEFYATFDLTPGSLSRKRLTAYVMTVMEKLYGENAAPIKFQR